ncbi:MAG: hypothetical protein K0S81_3754 [Rhodospirillales bacterium]|nr:hypothetical protein [Rhodospirillales bacterium]
MAEAGELAAKVLTKSADGTGPFRSCFACVGPDLLRTDVRVLDASKALGCPQHGRSGSPPFQTSHAPPSPKGKERNESLPAGAALS